MLVAAGLPMRQLGLAAGVGAALVMLFAIFEPYRRARLTRVPGPVGPRVRERASRRSRGRSRSAPGGMFGHGLGASIQKIFYVPEAHTDFILAVIGEELGLAGILGAAVAVRHHRVRRAADRPQRQGHLREAPRRRPDLTDPVPSPAQRLRRPRPRAADRRPAAVHLLRLDVADRAARRDGPAAQRRRRRLDAACAPSRATLEGRRVTAPPRIVIAAGGTAGHVVPAIAVADALRAEGAEVTLRRRRARRGRARPQGRLRARHAQRRGPQPHEPAEGRPRRSARPGAAVAAARRILRERAGRRRARRRRLRRRAGRPRRGADEDPARARRGRLATSASPTARWRRGPAASASPSRSRAATATATASPAAPSRPSSPTARWPARSSGSARTRPACSSSAARSARARSTRPRPRRSRTRRTASSTSPARATTPTSRAPARTTCCSTT